MDSCYHICSMMHYEKLLACNNCRMVTVCIMFSIYHFSPWYMHRHTLWINWLWVKYLCMYACEWALVNDISEGAIYSNSFDSVFQMDTVGGMHVCACMCTVHGSIFMGMIKYYLFLDRLKCKMDVVSLCCWKFQNVLWICDGLKLRCLIIYSL